MNAYLISIVNDSKVYINDAFKSLSQKINELGYELKWRENVTLSVDPILKDFRAHKLLVDLDEGIRTADSVAIDSRLADTDPVLFGVSIGILSGSNHGYGSYVIGPDNTNQAILDDSLDYKDAKRFVGVKVDAESGITASTDGVTYAGATISEVLGAGFDQVEIDSTLNPGNIRVASLLGRAYTDKAKISYSPVNPNSVIKVIIK